MALLLAVFCGVWSWLYTYEKDKKKFWVGLLVPSTFFLISFASFTVYEHASLDGIFGLLGLFSIIEGGLIAIFYAAYRPKIWYEEYLDWRGVLYLDTSKILKWVILGIVLLVPLTSVVFYQWIDARQRWLETIVYSFAGLAPVLGYFIAKRRTRGQALLDVKKLLDEGESLHYFVPISACAIVQRQPNSGKLPDNSWRQNFGVGLLGATNKKLLFYENKRQVLRSFAYGDIGCVSKTSYKSTNVGSVSLLTEKEEVVCFVTVHPSHPKNFLAFISFIQNRITTSCATSEREKMSIHNFKSQISVISSGIAILIFFNLLVFAVSLIE